MKVKIDNKSNNELPKYKTSGGQQGWTQGLALVILIQKI